MINTPALHKMKKVLEIQSFKLLTFTQKSFKMHYLSRFSLILCTNTQQNTNSQQPATYRLHREAVSSSEKAACSLAGALAPFTTSRPRRDRNKTHCSHLPCSYILTILSITPLQSPRALSICSVSSPSLGGLCEGHPSNISRCQFWTLFHNPSHGHTPTLTSTSLEDSLPIH